MPTKLFISYSREDKAIAHQVADALALRGYDVFWDAKIPAGEKFDTYIFGKLEESDVVVVLWSVRSVRSDYVKEEAEYGKNQTALVPLRIDDTTLPFGFTRIQVIDIGDWSRSANASEWQLVVDSIEATLNASSAERHSAPELVVSRPAGSKRARRSTILALAVVAAMLVGVFALGRYFRSGDAGITLGGSASELEAKEPAERKDEEAAKVPEPAVAEPPEPEAKEPAKEVARKRPEPTRSANVARRPADLTVIVYPWGEVWINGKKKGSSPLKNVSLKPGRYRISAGRGEASVTRTVRLAPGDEKTVHFDLTK